MRTLATILLVWMAFVAPGAAVTASVEASAPDAGWEPAHWELRDGTHVWVEGHSVPRPEAPRRDQVWVSGHWTWTSDGWVWDAGHYRTVATETVADVPVRAPEVEEEVVVSERPPPLRVEVVPVCPGADYCWSGGYWSWGVHTWVWVPGCWRHAPARGASWSAPRWTEVHGGGRPGFHFVPGGWRR